MLRGLYTSGHGMKVQSKLNDITANNMANAQTVGYKKDIGVMTSFPDMLLHRMEETDKKENPSHLPPRVGYLSTGVIVEETIPIINKPGHLQETNSPLDVAIIGQGFFVVNTGPDGQAEGLRYTKQGNFKLNQEQMLVTVDGQPVQGQNGNIYLAGTNIKIDESGQIFVDDQYVDTLQLVNFAETEGLRKEGATLFLHQNQEAVMPVADPQVKQGFLEGSNVDPVYEMVNMIQVMRAYEANQKAVQAHDQTLDKAVNEVGRS